MVKKETNKQYIRKHLKATSTMLSINPGWRNLEVGFSERVALGTSAPWQARSSLPQHLESKEDPAWP